MMSKPGFAVLRRAFRLLRKAVAWIAAAILILSPASSPSLSQSRPVTPDPQAPQANRPDVGAARNGVPVIDIVKPNSDGVSHNKFKDFNVGEEGMILNNSPKPGPSALGGTIGGNPNLKGGDSARLILNEVTGVNRSQLDGYIEVFGPSAGVIIANPNGITCQGCGFHNVQHGILSTGRPVFDENGAFTGLSVDGGDVRIEMSGKREPDKDYGLDASGTDYFDIVSRSIVINGFVHGGKDLRYLFGRNTYNYASREVTAKADDGSEKPLFGLDSSALGGAYAGKITLIGTENGVGVKTPKNMSAGAGGMSLTADGRIVLGNAQSQGRIAVRSKRGDIQVEKDSFVWSAEALELGAVTGISILGNSVVGAKGNVSVTGTGGLTLAEKSLLAAGLAPPEAGGLELTGPNALLVISQAYAKNEGGTIASSQDVNINLIGGLESSGQVLALGKLALTAGGLFVQESGEVAGAGGATIDVGNFENFGSVSGGGGELVVTSGDLLNEGTIGAGGNVSLTAEAGKGYGSGRIANRGDGAIVSDRDVSLNARNVFNEGQLGSAADDGTVAINASSLMVNSGSIAASQIVIDTLGFYNTGANGSGEGGQILGGTLTLSAVAGHNAGNIDVGNYEITMKDAPEGVSRAQLGLPEVLVPAGSYGNGANITAPLIANEFVNSGAMHAYGIGSVTAKNFINTETGTVASDFGLAISSENFDSRGIIFSEKYIDIAASTRFDNKGDIFAVGSEILDESTGAVVNYNAISIEADDFANDGVIAAAANNMFVGATGNAANSSRGLLYSGGSTFFSLGHDLLNNGEIISDKDITIFGAKREYPFAAAERAASDSTSTFFSATSSLVNRGNISANRTISAFASFDLGPEYERAGSIVNSSGIIEARSGRLDIYADEILNTREGADNVTVVTTTTRQQGDTQYTSTPNGRTTVVTETVTTTERLVNRDGKPIGEAGQMTAGNGMTLDGGAGGVANEYGIVSSGAGQLSTAGSKLTNIGADLMRTEQTVTTTTRQTWGCGGSDGRGCGSTETTDAVTSDPVAKVDKSFNASLDGTLFANVDGDITNAETGEIVKPSAPAPAPASTPYYNCGMSNRCDGINEWMEQQRQAEQKPKAEPEVVGRPEARAPQGGSGIVATGSSGLAADPNAPDLLNRTGAPQFDLSRLTRSRLVKENPASEGGVLFETDPRFAGSGDYYGSDEFLSRLNDTLAAMQKRLGDAYVERQVILDQVYKLTGRRFLHGFGSEDKMIEALYDNAVKAAKELNLVVGVALTPQQAAALQADIVWLVAIEVNGQTVLAPKLYLTDRTVQSLPSAGATIVGPSVDLNATGTLHNQGVIAGMRAPEAVAPESAPKASNVNINASTVNNMSGAIHGDNVAVRAQTIHNETIVTRTPNANGYTERAGQQARISAHGDIYLEAQGNINSIGGAIEAGGDAVAVAAGDINIAAQQVERYSSEGFKQGNASGSRTGYQRRNELAELHAGGDLILDAAGTTVVAGVDVSWGGSALFAGDEGVHFRSVQDIDQRSSWLRVEHSGWDNVLGKADYNRGTNATTTRTIGTNLQGPNMRVETEGGDVYVGGGVAIRTQTAPTFYVPDGRITYGVVTDTDTSSDSRSTLSFWWQSRDDKGFLDETVHHVEIYNNEGGRVNYEAVGEGVYVEYRQTEARPIIERVGAGDGPGDGYSRGQRGIRVRMPTEEELRDPTLDQLTAHSPGLAWMSQLRERGGTVGDVHWDAKVEIHDAWNRSAQGLTPQGTIIVTAVITAATAGAGSGTGALLGLKGATEIAVANAMGSALASSMINTAAISLINNQGDPFAAIGDLGSKEQLTTFGISVVTAGVLGAVNPAIADGMRFSSLPTQGWEKYPSLFLKSGVGNLTSAIVGATVEQIVRPGAFGENLFESLKFAGVNTIAETGAVAIGDGYRLGYIDDLGRYGLQAGLGCAIGDLAAGNCRAGAAGAVAGEFAADIYAATSLGRVESELRREARERNLTAEQIRSEGRALGETRMERGKAIGQAVGALAGGVLGDARTGSLTGGNAAENNASGAVGRIDAAAEKIIAEQLADSEMSAQDRLKRFLDANKDVPREELLAHLAEKERSFLEELIRSYEANGNQTTEESLLVLQLLEARDVAERRADPEAMFDWLTVKYDGVSQENLIASLVENDKAFIDSLIGKLESNGNRTAEQSALLGQLVDGREAARRRADPEAMFAWLVANNNGIARGDIIDALAENDSPFLDRLIGALENNGNRSAEQSALLAQLIDARDHPPTPLDKFNKFADANKGVGREDLVGWLAKNDKPFFNDLIASLQAKPVGARTAAERALLGQLVEARDHPAPRLTPEQAFGRIVEANPNLSREDLIAGLSREQKPFVDSLIASLQAIPAGSRTQEQALLLGQLVEARDHPRPAAVAQAAQDAPEQRPGLTAEDALKLEVADAKLPLDALQAKLEATTDRTPAQESALGLLRAASASEGGLELLDTYMKSNPLDPEIASAERSHASPGNDLAGSSIQEEMDKFRGEGEVSADEARDFIIAIDAQKIVSDLLRANSPEEARQHLAGQENLTPAQTKALGVLIDAQAQADAQETILAGLDLAVAAEKGAGNPATGDGWRSFDETLQDIEDSRNHVNPYTSEHFNDDDADALSRREVLELRALGAYLPATGQDATALPFDRQTLDALKDKPYLTKAEQALYDRLLAADLQGELRENWAMTADEKTLAGYMMTYGMSADTIRMYAAQAKDEKELSEMLARDYEMRQLNGVGGLGDVIVGNFMAELEMARTMGGRTASPAESLQRMGEGKVPNPLMEELAGGMRSLDAGLSPGNQAVLRGTLGVLDAIDQTAQDILVNAYMSQKIWQGLPESWQLMALGVYHGLGPAAPDATDIIGGGVGMIAGIALGGAKIAGKLDIPSNASDNFPMPQAHGGDVVPDPAIPHMLASGAGDASFDEPLLLGQGDLADAGQAREAGLLPPIQGPQPADVAVIDYGALDTFIRNTREAANENGPPLGEPWLQDVPIANTNDIPLATAANGDPYPAYRGAASNRLAGNVSQDLSSGQTPGVRVTSVDPSTIGAPERPASIRASSGGEGGKPGGGKGEPGSDALSDPGNGPGAPRRSDRTGGGGSPNSGSGGGASRAAGDGAAPRLPQDGDPASERPDLSEPGRPDIEDMLADARDAASPGTPEVAPGVPDIAVNIPDAPAAAGQRPGGGLADAPESAGLEDLAGAQERNQVAAGGETTADAPDAIEEPGMLSRLYSWITGGDDKTSPVPQNEARIASDESGRANPSHARPAGGGATQTPISPPAIPQLASGERLVPAAEFSKPFNRINAYKGSQATTGQWRSWLTKNSGVGKDDLLRTKVLEKLDALDAQAGGKSAEISKKELLRHIADNEITLKEEVRVGQALGQSIDLDALPFKSSLSEMGHPAKRYALSPEHDYLILQKPDGMYQAFRGVESNETRLVSSIDLTDVKQSVVADFLKLKSNTQFMGSRIAGGDGYVELVFTSPEIADLYKSTHLKTNEIVHARGNIRHTADGKNILFIHEIQSDLEKSARRRGSAEVDQIENRKIIEGKIEEIRRKSAPLAHEQGVASQRLRAEIAKALGVNKTVELQAIGGYLGNIRKETALADLKKQLTPEQAALFDGKYVNSAELSDFRRRDAELADLLNQELDLLDVTEDSPVPDVHFKGETALELALDRAIKFAEANGLDGVAIATSDQIAPAVHALPEDFPVHQYDRTLPRLLKRHADRRGTQTQPMQLTGVEEVERHAAWLQKAYFEARGIGRNDRRKREPAANLKNAIEILNHGQPVKAALDTLVKETRAFYDAEVAKGVPEFHPNDVLLLSPEPKDGAPRMPDGGDVARGAPDGFAPCGDGDCFAAGTKIPTPDGMRPIETIKVGDMVLVRDSLTGKDVVRPVTEVPPPRTASTLSITLERAGGARETLRPTPNEIFQVEGRGPVPASRLKPGDKIDGGALIVMAAQREAEPATVHNLKVDGQRNYLVGESKAVVRSQDSGSPGADGGVPPSGLDAPDAELGKIVDVEVVNWSKTGDPHDTPYMATVTYQFSDGTKSERTVHTDDLKQVERLVAAAEANRLADQQGAPKPSSDPTARQGQGQDPAARPVAGAPQPRNTAARLAGIRERINVQLALEKTRVRIMEENARRTVIENLPSDHPAYLDPADPALGQAQAKLRELDELRTMLSEDQDVAGSVMRDLSSPGKGPGGSEIAAQEIATPQDMSGPDEATRTDIRPPQRRSADGGHRATAGEVRRAPTSSAPGVDGRASTPPNPYISGETPVKMSPIERVAWWASQQFPRKQTYSVERYKQLHEAAAPELQARLPKPDTFTADEMTRLLAEVPGGLENLIGDIHAHNRSYAREEGGRYIQKLLLISGRNSRILFGSIPQCCGGDAHYSNANPSPATLRNAKQLDIDAIREFRWMFQTNPALAAKADLSLTGFDFSDRGNMDVVAYGRSHMLEHPGLFPFIGEVTGKKELVSVQLGPFAWDINSPRFQAYLRFANETGQGVLLHYDWGHHTIDGHSEVHGHGRPQGAKTAYENFPELIEVLSRPEYSDVNLIFAHTGIGRFVRPDSTLSPFTRPDGSVIDLPEHIQKLYKLFEAIPNARADISWNDVTQAYADSPHLREGLIAFVIDNQDRLIFGSDTVKPANSGQYHQGLNTGAPMFMELARRNPEAAWKLLRGNYETVLNSAYSRVANWTRRQPEMTNSRIAEMDAMLDTLQSQRQHMAAGARQDFETWLSLVSEAQGRMPDADAKRGAFPYLYESLPDAAHQHWHDDVEIQTGIGTSGGFAQQSPKRRLKGNAIAAATGAAAVAGGMAIDASPGIARIFDPVADGPGGALNAGAFEVRALLIGLRAIHGEALRLEHEAIFENGFVTRKSLDQYVSRIASAQKMLQLSDEKMLRISAATEQFWANYQYLRDMPIDNARGWTQQQRFHAIMAKAGEFIITLDRELGLQTSSVNGLDARRPLGQAMRAVTLGTYLVNDAATLSWLTSDGMDFSTPHGQTEAAYRILFGLGNAALTAHTIGTWSHGMAGRTADASPLMRFLQAGGLTSVAMSGIPWTLNDGMRFFDEVVTGDMAGASTAAAATVLDAAFSYYTARAAVTNWRGLAGGSMPTNSKIARPLVLLAGALALREIIALEEQASKDDEQRPAGPIQPVNLNGQATQAQPSSIPAENRPAGTPNESPDAGTMTFGTQAEEQGKATAQPAKAAPQDAKTPPAAADAKAATPPMPSRRDAGIAPRRDAAPQPKASPADARKNAPQTERKRVGAAGGDAGVDVLGVQRR